MDKNTIDLLKHFSEKYNNQLYIKTKLHFVNKESQYFLQQRKYYTEYTLSSSNKLKYQKDLMTPFRKKNLKSILIIV